MPAAEQAQSEGQAQAYAQAEVQVQVQAEAQVLLQHEACWYQAYAQAAAARW